MRLSRELSPFSPLDVSKSKEFKGHVKIAFAIALSESSKSTIINIIIHRDPQRQSHPFLGSCPVTSTH